MILLEDFKAQFLEFELTTELTRASLMHITTRRFGDSDPIQFVSYVVESLSVEALVWVLRAIRRDEMTPTDKLLQSRMKECYGMKM
jgi:hypothetical protein